MVTGKAFWSQLVDEVRKPEADKGWKPPPQLRDGKLSSRSGNPQDDHKITPKSSNDFHPIHFNTKRCSDLVKRKLVLRKPKRLLKAETIILIFHNKLRNEKFSNKQNFETPRKLNWFTPPQISLNKSRKMRYQGASFGRFIFIKNSSLHLELTIDKSELQLIKCGGDFFVEKEVEAWHRSTLDDSRHPSLVKAGEPFLHERLP